MLQGFSSGLALALTPSKYVTPAILFHSLSKFPKEAGVQEGSLVLPEVVQVVMDLGPGLSTFKQLFKD